MLILLTSFFISWIFAKSVTNAANLGYSFGIVGGLAMQYIFQFHLQVGLSITFD